MTQETDFFRGNYQKILSATVDSQSGAIPLASVAYIIGSLTFKGRLDEALTLYSLFQKQMPEESVFLSRFYLGINLSRHSRHAEGRRFLAENLRNGAHHPNPRLRFFAWQGVGYYRLCCCRYRSSLRYASQALAAALEANFLYGKALASDLMAHSQNGPGQIRSAGESFRRALSFAELLGDGGLYQAIKVSMVIHSAQHGFDPQHDIKCLEQIAETLTLEDNYSKSRLLLELGRQHLLRGSLVRAKTCLDDACRLVYSSQNRRYGIILNMRYAYIAYLEGEFHQGLNLIRNAAKNLDPLVEKHIAVEILGLESRLLDRVPCSSLDQERAAVYQRLQKLSAETCCTVSQRILQRKVFGSYNGTSLMGDDPLGDLVDISFSRGDIANKRILDSGFLSLLYQKLNWQPGTSGLYLDLIPGSLLAYENGDIHYMPSGISHVIRTLLQQLAKGVGTKENLITSIWQYEYNPLKHDQLIYTAVSRLRQLLGPYAHWIEMTETGYALKSGLRLDIPTAVAVPLPMTVHTVVEAESAHVADWRQDLNHRQLVILEDLRKEPFLDARACMDRFQVSEASARRDLSLLIEKGLLRRQGKGRAIRYTLTTSPETQWN